MRGLGNYHFEDKTERRPGQLMFYRGSKAVVRFHDGQSYAMPDKAFRRLGLAPDDRFVMVVMRKGKKVSEVRVERIAEARPARDPGALPKVVMRSGKKLITRKSPGAS